MLSPSLRTCLQVFLACDPVSSLTPPVFTAVFATLASHRFKDTVLRATTAASQGLTPADVRHPGRRTSPQQQQQQQQQQKRGTGNSWKYMKHEDIARHLNPLLAAFEKKLRTFLVACSFWTVKFLLLRTFVPMQLFYCACYWTSTSD